MTNEIKFEVSRTLPPKEIYEECVKRFGADFMKGTIFAYDNKIHALNDVTGDLLAHELVHLDQQHKFGGAKKWWKKYLSDSKFRIEQEVEAYQNQWDWAKENANRDYRRALEKHILKMLSSKLYGKVITKKEAQKLVIF